MTGVKRTISESYSSDNGAESESESLTISDILTELHVRYPRYPRLNFPQYEGVLANRGIVYAEKAMDFEKDFYLELGIAEGAIGPFIKGIGRALHREKKGKKRAKFEDKENQQQNRQESIEV